MKSVSTIGTSAGIGHFEGDSINVDEFINIFTKLRLPLFFEYTLYIWYNRLFALIPRIDFVLLLKNILLQRVVGLGYFPIVLTLRRSFQE